MEPVLAGVTLRCSVVLKQHRGEGERNLYTVCRDVCISYQVLSSSKERNKVASCPLNIWIHTDMCECFSFYPLAQAIFCLVGRLPVSFLKKLISVIDTSKHFPWPRLCFEIRHVAQFVLKPIILLPQPPKCEITGMDYYTPQWSFPCFFRI